ncbi:hypothetical protein ACIBJF_17355 [Streptomyces sp. NPDC050743]|uniref:hypothetical protein n=1 Tax=Streptomyces sp. NPDC050743 TaxID=3365634 RepID=UPI00379B4459
MRPKVESIAARLAAATGSEVHREEIPAGVRLVVDLPPELGEVERKEVLAALASADEYGHRRTDGGDSVWALVHSDTTEHKPGDRVTGPGSGQRSNQRGSVDMTNGTARPPASARGSGMTMRVYTVNRYGVITRVRGMVTVAFGNQPLPVGLDTEFPPCTCPRCRAGQAVNR